MEDTIKDLNKLGDSKMRAGARAERERISNILSARIFDQDLLNELLNEIHKGQE